MINLPWHALIKYPFTGEIVYDISIILLLISLLLVIRLVYIKRQLQRVKTAKNKLIIRNNTLQELNSSLDNQVLQDTEQLRDSEQKYRCLVENLRDEYFFYKHDIDGIFSYLSPSITTVLGYSIEEFSQHYSTFQTDHPENEKIDEYTRRGLKGEKVPTYQVELLDSKGDKHTLEIQENPVYNQQGNCIGLCGIAHDISVLVQTRERLTVLSCYDDLTGLANAHLFSERAAQMISLSYRQHKSLSLLYLDLNGFKLINEGFGHAAGDAVLKEIANRLETLLRDSDTAARLGGNAFALILLGSGTRAAKIVVKKVLNSLLSPYAIDDQVISIGCSLGIAIYPKDGNNSVTLLQQAERAMIFAKSNNKAYAFCTPKLDEASQRRLKLEQGLREVLSENSGASPPDLSLVYQSKHYLKDNSIQGYEALIRWQHPELGEVSPGELIPLAEQTGLIVALSHWVITQACLQAVQWDKEGFKFEKIAVNISPIELVNSGLATDIIRKIDATGAQRKWVEIEITESAVMKMPGVSNKVIEELVDAGVLINIDGFGIGHSSIPFLKKLAATYLKIDPSFIHKLLASPEDQDIVRALISMSHALNKKVIAVGVETAEQLQCLQECGCDIAQGNYFSSPSPAQQVQLYISQIYS